ncbi:MAG: flagellar basal body-associated FliL family protein [Candidatus Krumholzibacteriia bacterium]
MADEKKQDEKAPARKAGLLDNKVVVLGGVVALQLVIAVVLTTVVIMPRLGASQAGAGPEAVVMEKPEAMGVLLSLGEIIVTLQGTGNSGHYLRITVDLELLDQAASDLAAERLPILRDTVIMTLSDRSAADINRPEGMKGLRDELMRRLDERLPKGALRHIYFSDLVIQ